jgi:hypothetical protein
MLFERFATAAAAGTVAVAATDLTGLVSLYRSMMEVPS